MTAGFGVDPTKNGSGVITSGTSAQDIRKVWAGLYTKGVISGGVVSLSSASMTYTVTAGVAAIPVGTGETVLAPIPATTINAASVPVSGSRVDVIFAKQKLPTVDGSSDIVVDYGPTLPPNAVLLNQFTQPAGATTTSAGSKSAPIDYSIPYGAGLGILHRAQWTTSGDLPNTSTLWGSAQVYLPTDRWVRYSLHGTLNASGAVGFDNSKYVEYAFIPRLDSNPVVGWNSPGLTQGWSIYQFATIDAMTAGLHTVDIKMFRGGGSGTAQTHYGTYGEFIHKGIEFIVEDLGPVV